MIRSALFVLPHDPRSVDRARAARPDVAIVDLEDGVPAEQAATARQLLPSVAADLVTLGVRTVVRVPAADEPGHDEDVDRALRAGADGVVLPKADPGAVARLTPRLAAEASPVRLWAMVESVAAGEAVPALLDAGPVDVVTIGYGDLCKELGLPLGSDHPELAPVRDRVLVAARAAGVPAVDGLLVGPPDVAETACAASAALGFAGRLLYDSRHVEGCNRAFGTHDRTT